MPVCQIQVRRNFCVSAWTVLASDPAKSPALLGRGPEHRHPVMLAGWLIQLQWRSRIHNDISTGPGVSLRLFKGDPAQWERMKLSRYNSDFIVTLRKLYLSCSGKKRKERKKFDNNLVSQSVVLRQFWGERRGKKAGCFLKGKMKKWGRKY